MKKFSVAPMAKPSVTKVFSAWLTSAGFVCSCSGNKISFGLEAKEGREAFIQLYSSSTEFFRLKTRDLDGSIDCCAYIWNFDPIESPFSPDEDLFLLTPPEALEFLGPLPLATRSWRETGSYSFSPCIGLPFLKRQQFVNAFGRRGKQWLLDEILEKK